MSHFYTPVVYTGIFLTKLLHLKGGDKNGFSRLVYSFANKKELLNTKFTGTPSARQNADFLPEDVFTLNKTPGRDFLIMNIADIHFSDYDYRLVYGFNAFRKVKSLVKKYKPDLITLTGDQVCTEGTKYSVDVLTRKMDTLGVPWAPVFGNHDAEGNCDRDFIAEEMMKGKNCLFAKGCPDIGVGNYAIEIKSGEKRAHALFMMDFHRHEMDEKQLAWLKAGTEKTDCESSVFGHIPLAEYKIAYDENCKNGNFTKESFGAGRRGEKEATMAGEPGADGNIFDEILKNGRTKFIFTGHDHLNDYSLSYRGIRLTYMLKTGKGAGNTLGMNGATFIKIGDDGIKNVSHVTKTFGFPVTIQSVNFENGAAVEVEKDRRITLREKIRL